MSPARGAATPGDPNKLSPGEKVFPGRGQTTFDSEGGEGAHWTPVSGMKGPLIQENAWIFQLKSLSLKAHCFPGLIPKFI